jgi:hypothetical protein
MGLLALGGGRRLIAVLSGQHIFCVKIADSSGGIRDREGKGSRGFLQLSGSAIV